MKNYFLTFALLLSTYSSTQAAQPNQTIHTTDTEEFTAIMSGLFNQEFTAFLKDSKRSLTMEEKLPGSTATLLTNWLLKSVNPFQIRSVQYSPNISFINPSVFSVLEDHILQLSLKSDAVSQRVLTLYKKLHEIIIKNANFQALLKEAQEIDTSLTLTDHSGQTSMVLKEKCQNLLRKRLDNAVANLKLLTSH